MIILFVIIIMISDLLLSILQLLDVLMLRNHRNQLWQSQLACKKRMMYQCKMLRYFVY